MAPPAAPPATAPATPGAPPVGPGPSDVFRGGAAPQLAPQGPDGGPAPVRDAERLRVLPEEEAGGRTARRIDDLRRQRQERREGDALVIREPGRTIIRENDRFIIERDETQRFRGLGLRPEVERRGEFNRTVFVRPDGTRIITITDDEGRLVRRLRQRPGGEELIIIDNTRRERRGPGRYAQEVIVLERPPLTIPRERYILEADEADEGDIYETITAEPIARLPRSYTLDEVRYSPDLRSRMRSVDINTITFETGAWTLGPAQARQLAAVAQAIRRAVEASPQEVFLIEGHTDAVGGEIDNLSLSDRRAQAVAEALTRDFGVPPENLTTQGYGEQYLKVATQGPSRENRRVTLRRITPLLNQQGQAPQ